MRPKRLIEPALVLAAFTSLGSLLASSSQIPCESVKYLEMHRNFVVSVTHEHQPVAGATIKIYAKDVLLLSGKPKADGAFRVVNLRPGTYSIGVAFLGIRAGADCFYVKSQPSRHAKRALKYFWGEDAPVVRQVAGKLVERQPGTGGSPAWNREHPESVPLSGATLRLQNSENGASYSTASSEDGGFTFDKVPRGTYVLQVQYGKDSSDGSDRIVIQVDPNAAANTISLTRKHSVEGGTYLSLY